MERDGRLLALLTVFFVAACGSTAANGLATPHPQHPTPVDARLESESFVWRASPPPLDGARQTVRRFFDSVAHEAGPELESLFAEEALFHRPNQSATPAALTWLRRLSAGDYTLQPVPADVPMQLLDHAASRRLTKYRTVHLQPQSGEVLAVVALPMPVANTQSAALWGSELQLVLTRRNGDWRIRELWEDYVAR